MFNRTLARLVRTNTLDDRQIGKVRLSAAGAMFGLICALMMAQPAGAEAQAGLSDEDLVAGWEEYFECVLKGGKDCDEHVDNIAPEQRELLEAAAELAMPST